MTLNKIKQTEQETLATFQQHRPSEYFSHLAEESAFEAHDRRVERLYRFGLALPPEFFLGKNLIDLGAGTGENTVSLARWGANCTLVEMNHEALLVAKEVFTKLAPEGGHIFVAKSLYDLDLGELAGQFDFAHSRGVFTHVADKPRAFEILTALARPGGYVIYGDRNSCGGIQEMLQRFAIYSYAGQDSDAIVETAEALFSEDIDRSQRAVPRTRKAIIFDRWVIQQQDDPTISEVLDMSEREGLEYVTSWPRIDYLGRGSSTHSDPREGALIRDMSPLVENLWMILNTGDVESCDAYMPIAGGGEYLHQLAGVAASLRNLQAQRLPSATALLNEFSELRSLSQKTWEGKLRVRSRLDVFIKEVSAFIELIQHKEPLDKLRKSINGFSILFRGYAGVRHVDYVFYKPGV